MDLSKLSTEDLLALKSGDLSKVSTEGLMNLRGGQMPTSAAPAVQAEEQPQSKVMQALGNVPSSAGRFVGGLANAVMHPIDTASGLLDIGAGALRNAMPEAVTRTVEQIQSPEQQASAERASGAASAAGQFYRDRYGGLENVQKTLVEDPVGAVADLSTVLGLGGGAARLANAPRTGAALSTASKYTNPLSVVPPVVKATGQAGEHVLGLTTGIGAENISQAAKSGAKGDTSFLRNMTGEVSMADVLTEAKDALRNMRESRMGTYREGIAATAADATPLRFDAVDNALTGVVDSLKYKGKWKIGKDQVGKINELNKVVAEWRGNKTLHTPMGLDALKQRLDAIYPDSPMHAQVQRAVTRVRNAVKDTIVEQSPQYAETMATYEKALNIEKEIERALSLGSKASQDTAMRKLQSLSRNNANTNYGNRLELARTLEAEGGANILPAIAGQAMSSWTPRSLSGQAGGLATLGAAATTNPAVLGLLPFQSPKAMGSLLYGGGRAVGAAGRGLKAAGVTPERARLLGLLGYELGQDMEGQ